MDEKINVPDLSGASSQLIAEQVIRILNERKSHNLKLLHV
jgi:hypothetical protein